MKKIILPLIIILAAYLPVLAQPAAVTGKVEFQKGDKSSAVIELPYSPDIIEKAIKENMLRNGIKEETTKGFQVFKGARLTPTDGEVSDLYFKVDRKSRRDNTSVVYLVIGRPNENVALRTSEDAYKVDDAKTFLNNMVPSVDAYNLEVQIGDQANLITKQEKKLSNLKDDQKSLENKIQNFEDKLAQVKKDIENQSSELDKQRAVKDAMQARRVVK